MTSTQNRAAEQEKQTDDVCDFIDEATFEQIREMDDDDDAEFSRAIVSGFMEQAEETFVQMQDFIKKGDLEQLSSLGHFLKGSSATLGLIKVKEYCEKIQHFGAKKDDTGLVDVDDEQKCLSNISKALTEMEREYKRAKVYFDRLYPSEA